MVRVYLTFYNSLGNVLWFIPFGFFISYSYSEKSMVGTILAGGCLSVIIESLQFVLETGVSDIDDVFLMFAGL